MNRRRNVRRSVAVDEPLARARLRTGARLLVLDASSSGALVETTERLLPGRRLDAHLMTQDGRVLVRGRVVRAYVSRVQPDAICYRAALVFDQHINASGRAVNVADADGVARAFG
jgi:hypothetical protein